MASEVYGKIRAGNKLLKTILVAQNEVGNYYIKGGKLAKFLLAGFDTAKGVGLVKYSDGSHRFYRSQEAIDFSIPAGVPITFDYDVKVEFTSPGSGSYVKVTAGGTKLGIKRYTFYLVHTYKWAKPGTVVKAGKPVCYIAPTSVTGYPAHLHIYAKKFGLRFKVRDLILAA